MLKGQHVSPDQHHGSAQPPLCSHEKSLCMARAVELKSKRLASELGLVRSKQGKSDQVQLA